MGFTVNGIFFVLLLLIFSPFYAVLQAHQFRVCVSGEQVTSHLRNEQQGVPQAFFFMM